MFHMTGESVATGSLLLKLKADSITICAYGMQGIELGSCFLASTLVFGPFSSEFQRPEAESNHL